MKEQAKRYNKGKTRHELVSAIALEEVAKVYTLGSHKYSVYKDSKGKLIQGKDISFSEVGNYTLVEDGANNWRKGQKWIECMGSVKRHINAWERGEDNDNELGTFHLANAAWGLFALLDFYKSFPQGDNRFRIRDIPKIGLDIDEVLAKFTTQYDKHYKTGIPSSWNFDKNMSSNLKKKSKDKKFWMDIEPHISGHDIPFEPAVYITARPVDSAVTEAWLKKHNFPVAPVVTVKPGESKLDVIKKHNLDIFVDDNYKTFCEINNDGSTLCLLFAAPHNERYKKQAGHLRISNLNEVLKTF